MYMIITVLLSTYNGEKFLDKQLESIINQVTDKTINILVRDDGSTDNTIAILNKWKKKINIDIIHGENIGVIESFNLLINKAPKSDFYALCDQDDIWFANKIESALDKLQEEDMRNVPSLYFSNATLIDEFERPLGMNINSDRMQLSLEKAMVCNPALGCTMIFNHSALQLINSVQIKKSPMHDKTILFLCLLVGRVIYDKNPTIYYRQHSNNVMGRKKSLRKKIKQSYRLWIKADGCTIVEFSEELLVKLDGVINQKQIEILSQFKDYKKSFKHKIKLICNKHILTDNKRANISFKLRVLFGLA